MSIDVSHVDLVNDSQSFGFLLFFLRIGIFCSLLRFWKCWILNWDKMSRIELSRAKSAPVPLGTLIGRELRNGKVEKPFVKYGQSGLAKKGEDYFLIKTDCLRVPGDASTAFSVFAVLFFFLVYAYIYLSLLISFY